MKLFARGRTSRAPARILSIETTDRMEHVCDVEVQPPTASAFRSTLRTRAPMVPDATMTYVLYDPDSPQECSVDVKRLRSHGVRDGRGYASRGWDSRPAPQQIELADAKTRLQQLDALNAEYKAGGMNEDEFRERKAHILQRPPQAVS